jgi:hypothetical protein
MNEATSTPLYNYRRCLCGNSPRSVNLLTVNALDNFPQFAALSLYIQLDGTPRVIAQLPFATTTQSINQLQRDNRLSIVDMMNAKVMRKVVVRAKNTGMECECMER